MLKLKKFIFYWLPLLTWMSIIFYLSSRQRLAVSETYFLNFLFFKTLHVVEYAILYFLIFRAFSSFKSLSKRGLTLAAIVVAITYAISDEVHQLYVPTREGTVRDVFIDIIGILMMYIYIRTKSYEKV